MSKHKTNMTLAEDLFRGISNDQRLESDKGVARDTLHGHCQVLQDRLGLRDPDIAEVLQDLADWFSDSVSFTTT